jgi:hypothetical protein
MGKNFLMNSPSRKNYQWKRAMPVALLALAAVFTGLAPALQAQDDNYLHVNEDLRNGMELQDIADRAYDNAPRP